jgi:hypothetical protein
LSSLSPRLLLPASTPPPTLCLHPTSRPHLTPQDLNRAAITAALDACLATPEEAAAAAAGALPDPLFGEADDEEEGEGAVPSSA